MEAGRDIKDSGISCEEIFVIAKLSSSQFQESEMAKINALDRDEKHDW